jgi:hypothetical protein
MGSNSVLKHKFFLFCAAFCGAILVSSQDTKALSIGDSHELGFLWPGIQNRTENQNKALYVNHLIGMALGAVEVVRDEVYFRSNHGFASLPAAGAAHDGRRRVVNLGGGGLYTYLFATYRGYGTEVWYVGNLHGIVSIPFFIARHAHELTGWTLFSAAGVGVPDGGITVMLLGVALGVIALARRFLTR